MLAAEQSAEFFISVIRVSHREKEAGQGAERGRWSHGGEFHQLKPQWSGTKVWRKKKTFFFLIKNMHS